MTSVQRLPSTGPATPPSRLLRHASVSGVGAYLPETVITNADLEKRVETSDTWILERTGIRTRHQIGSGETVVDMSVKAARIALEMAGADSVDAIVCATCSPDTLVPSSACLIQRELNMPGIPAFDVNAACSGYVYGMQVATTLVSSGAYDRVLLVTAEAMTRIVDYHDRSTCVLFGDGAGASVISVSDTPGVHNITLGADGGQAEIIYYGPKQDEPETDDWLRMAGRGTYRLAVDRLCAMTQEVAAGSGWSLEDVDWFVPHQANLRIIESAAKRLGAPMEKVIVNVDSVGNTSAASIALALAEAHASGRIKKGDRIVCVAFGAGATWGGVGLEWSV